MADCIESLSMRSSPLFPKQIETKLEALVQFFSNKILSKNTIAKDALLPLKSENTDFNELAIGNYRNSNLDRIVTEEVREMGTELLCYKAIEQLGILNFGYQCRPICKIQQNS